MDRRKTKGPDLKLSCYLRFGSSSFDSGSRGTTENLSREGGLLRIQTREKGERPPELGEYIEALVELPRNGGGKSSRCLHCYAKVVWTTQAEQGDHLVGIQIDWMRFEDLPTALKNCGYDTGVDAPLVM